MIGCGPRVGVLVAAGLIAAGCEGASPGTNDHTNNNNANANNNECTPENMCYVDFPCGVNTACVLDATQVVMDNETYGCEEVCGPCCSGAGCTPGTVDCAAGEVCAYPDSEPVGFILDARYNPGLDVPRCVPLDEVCGGLEGLTCPAGEFCELVGALCPPGDPYPDLCIGSQGYPDHDFCAYGDAGGYGRCRPIPDPAECAGLATERVCGCDGVTYDNDCLRQAAGVAHRHTGACEP